MSKKNTTKFPLRPKTKRAKSNPTQSIQFILFPPSSSQSDEAIHAPLGRQQRLTSGPASPRRRHQRQRHSPCPWAPSRPPLKLPNQSINQSNDQTTSGRFPPHRAARLPPPRSEPRRPPDSRVPCATYLRRPRPRLPRLVAGCSGWVVARGGGGKNGRKRWEGGVRRARSLGERR